MKTRFLGQAYQSRSPILASQTAINIYAESTEGNSDDVGAYYGTAGIVSKFQGVVGEVRGMHAATDKNLYAVIGSTVYRLSPSLVPTILGTLPNNSGRVSIKDNGSQVVFAHASGMHFVAFAGNSIAAVANAPNDAVVTVMDNYALFTEGSGGQFGITALADLSTIDPLDVATAEGLPDDLVSVLAWEREAWLLGLDSIEIWTDTGAALFPFERAPGGFIEQGCAAKRSPVKLDNSVFWVGHDEKGHGIVYRSNAYVPTRISTHAMEFAINQYSKISDAIGITYQEEGHSFYWLIFPSGDDSWTYDVATGGWHQRKWLDTQGLLHRHRANCLAFFNGMHLIGDWQNGKIYQLSLSLNNDDGNPIYRERAFDLPDAEDKRVRIDRVELISLSGDIPVDPNGQLVALEISKDAGRTFGYKRIISNGKTGQTNFRNVWRPCTHSRQTVLRFSSTMNNRVHWTGCDLRGEELDQ